MKFPAIVAVLALAAACSTQPDPPSSRPHADQVELAPFHSQHLMQFKAVDNNSTYMQRLFEHVSRDHEHAAAIHAEQEQWRTASGGPVEVDYYLTGPSHDALLKYLSAAAAGDPSLAVPRDRELGFEQNADGQWRTYLLASTVELDNASIAHLQASEDPGTHRPIVLVDFTPTAAQHFTELTTRLTGHKLAVLVDGSVTSAPIIQEPITGGRASLSIGAHTTPVEQQAFVDSFGAGT